jgi:tRNA(Ile)-lysidine synthase
VSALSLATVATRDGVAEVALAELRARLNGPRGAPVAVAVSGGGDSLALLLIADRWARAAGRPLVVFTVDHRLQAASADWCAFVTDRAARLGLACHTLRWVGEKPANGLPAAARAARHALVAEAAREAGARVVLMGHTADDVAEAREMRRTGSSVPDPAPWGPSPAWPEGRGVLVCRPLLGLRRAALRAWLTDLGERWIDDPANDDSRYARAAARRGLADGAVAATPGDRRAAPLHGVAMGPGGDVSLPRDRLRDADGTRLLGAVLLCASGGRTPPRRARLTQLLTRLAAGEDLTATLAGARIEAWDNEVTVVREAGEHIRDGVSEAELPVGVSVFDGRFELVAAEPGWRIRPLRGAAKRLPAAQRTALSALAPAARGALPLAISPAGDHCCPILARSGMVTARALGLERLQAALGAFADEAALWRVAKPPAGP